jgi:uncharacterized small protein (DUF1192 family)
MEATMADVDDDPWGARPQRKTQVTHEIGEVLDRLSVDELDERIGLLRREIARLDAQRTVKLASRAGADAFFKGGSSDDRG